MNIGPFDKPGSFYRGNLHTPSTASDGARSPRAVCYSYRRRGYDFISLTDHFVERYGYPVSDTRPFRTDGFTTVIGAEVHTPATSLGDDWHILAVGLPLDFAPTEPHETGAALAARARDAGAYVAAAHPAWYDLTDADVQALTAASARITARFPSMAASRKGVAPVTLTRKRWLAKPNCGGCAASRTSGFAPCASRASTSASRPAPSPLRDRHSSSRSVAIPRKLPVSSVCQEPAAQCSGV